MVVFAVVGVAVRRSTAAERILEGQAVIVVPDGAPMTERLQQERLTLEDLHSAAREKGYAHLDEIALGVMEPDGTFSFVPRGDRG